MTHRGPHCFVCWAPKKPATLIGGVCTRCAQGLVKLGWKPPEPKCPAP